MRDSEKEQIWSNGFCSPMNKKNRENLSKKMWRCAKWVPKLAISKLNVKIMITAVLFYSFLILVRHVFIVSHSKEKFSLILCCFSSLISFSISFQHVQKCGKTTPFFRVFRLRWWWVNAEQRRVVQLLSWIFFPFFNLDWIHYGICFVLLLFKNQNA